MIRLEVGAPSATKTVNEILAKAAWVQKLLGDPMFGELMVETADACVHEWGLAQTTEARERAWYKLQGLHALLRQLQKADEQGFLAARSIEGDAAGANHSTP